MLYLFLSESILEVASTDTCSDPTWRFEDMDMVNQIGKKDVIPELKIDKAGAAEFELNRYGDC
jgi:hypothetical protein